jgi:hypothetical protein
MAHPTDIYVALSDAPAGIEDTFEFFKPTAERVGKRLVLLFEDVPADQRDVATLRGEIALRLNGCEYYYAELTGGDDREVIWDAGDIRHVPRPEDFAPAEPEPWPDAATHAFFAASDLCDDELAELKERFHVHAVYTNGDAHLVHITSQKQYVRWSKDDDCEVLEWPELLRTFARIGAEVEFRDGYTGRKPSQCPWTWCAATGCGVQLGDWSHRLWKQFGMKVESSFTVSFGA